MKPYIVAFALCLAIFTSSCHGQIDYSIDSIRVVGSEWRVDTVGDGIILRRYHFGEGALFCSAQYLNVIEIPAGSGHRLAFVCDSIPLTVSEFGQRTGAVAAVNGSFFDMDLGTPICYLRIGGKAFGENTPSKTDSTNRKYYQHASIVLADGQPTLVVPDSNRMWEESLADSNIMTAGPMLLWDGKEVGLRDDRTFVTHRHNRTALGIKPDGTTVLLVADGRFKHRAEGLSLPELQRVMRWLGCSKAINLDGGGSSTLYVKDRPYNGVVNYPSDNNRYDHEGERRVANAIVIL